MTSHHFSPASTQSKPNILLIARHYWPRPGAATGRLTRFAKSCRDQGYQLWVATGSVVAEQSGPHGELLVPLQPDHSEQAFPVRASNMVRAAVQLRRHKQLNEVRFDAVLSDPPSSYAAEGLRIARKNGAPFTFYFADSWAAHLQGTGKLIASRIGAVVRRQEEHLFREADGVITVHERHREWATPLNPRTLHLPNGVNADVFRPDGPRISSLVPQDLPYFVYPGNYGALHGAHIFLDAARLAWDRGARFRMVFVGYGSDADKVQQLRADFPDLFIAHGPVVAEEAATLIRGAQAGLASVAPERDYESLLPVKAMASVVSGTPLIFAGGGDFVSAIGELELGKALAFDAEAVAEGLVAQLSEPWSANDALALAKRARPVYSNNENGDIILDYVLRPRPNWHAEHESLNTATEMLQISDINPPAR